MKLCFKTINKLVDNKINQLANQNGHALNLLKKEEISKIQFQKRYRFFSVITMILLILFVILVPMGISFGLQSFQKLIFENSSSILFITSERTFFTFFLSSFIICMPLSGMFFSAIVHKSARFETYLVIQNLKKGIKGLKYDYEKYVYLKVVIITIIITLPLMVIAFFNYTNITTEKIYHNEMFSLTEKIYEWEDIQYVKISCQVKRDSKDRDRLNLNREYTLNFNDGEKINLWESFDFMKVALDINNLLISKNIYMEVSNIDNFTYLELLDRFEKTEIKSVYENILRIRLVRY